MLFGIIFSTSISFFTGCTSSANDPVFEYIDYISEVDSKFIITPNNEVIFSSNENNRYQLKVYFNGLVRDTIIHKNHLFNPFLFNNQLGGLYDDNGNELFFSTIEKLNKILLNKPLSWIESIDEGRFLIFKFHHDNKIYLLNAKTEKHEEIDTVFGKYHGSTIDNTNKEIFIGIDDNIIIYSLINNKTVYWANKYPGEKRNLYIANQILLYNSNYESDFQQIYQINLNDSILNRQRIHYSNNDVMMPIIHQDYLYYIESVNNQYLLRRKNLQNNTIEDITKRGVVYRYEFYQDKIVFSYSDFNLPRSILIYDLLTGEIKYKSGKPVSLDAEYIYKPLSRNLSPAYILKPKGKIKDIILYFHPGLHSDYSPRWDTILMTLLKNDYMIIAPNYPMSGGYGKKYQQMKFSDAIVDMQNWKNYIIKLYNLPELIMMASSSGNLLMEECVRIDPLNIKCAISLFGLYQSSKIIKQVPALYILGENDPKVNYPSRISTLYSSNIEILSFSNEGHWIRNKTNYPSVIKKILDFIVN